MPTLTITPTTLNIGDTETDIAAKTSVDLAADGDCTSITATSTDSQLLLKVIDDGGSYASSKTFEVLDTKTKRLGIQLIPTTEGDDLSLTFTIVHAGSSTNQTITVNFSSYENLETFGVIRVNKIIARDGVFSSSTINFGGVKVGADETGEMTTTTSKTEVATKFAKNFQIDDGLSIPRNSVKVDKDTDEVIIKTKRNEVVKVDGNGVVLVEQGVVLCNNISAISNNDWKLDRNASDGSTSLSKRISGEWVTRVAFT